MDYKPDRKEATECKLYALAKLRKSVGTSMGMKYDGNLKLII